jgi:hypothetical protein
LWIILILLVAVLLAILVPVILTGISASRTRTDRAAANETLRQAAALLGGRFRDRDEYPWYRRPARYGGVDGDLDGLGYELFVMPWNAEDCGGSAMLRIGSRQALRRSGNDKDVVVLFSRERDWHWPDLADPEALAAYARRAVAAVACGGVPPESR